MIYSKCSPHKAKEPSDKLIITKRSDNQNNINTECTSSERTMQMKGALSVNTRTENSSRMNTDVNIKNKKTKSSNGNNNNNTQNHKVKMHNTPKHDHVNSTPNTQASFNANKHLENLKIVKEDMNIIKHDNGVKHPYGKANQNGSKHPLQKQSNTNGGNNNNNSNTNSHNNSNSSNVMVKQRPLTKSKQQDKKSTTLRKKNVKSNSVNEVVNTNNKIDINDNDINNVNPISNDNNINVDTNSTKPTNDVPNKNEQKPQTLSPSIDNVNTLNEDNPLPLTNQINDTLHLQQLPQQQQLQNDNGVTVVNLIEKFNSVEKELSSKTDKLYQITQKFLQEKAESTKAINKLTETNSQLEKQIHQNSKQDETLHQFKSFLDKEFTTLKQSYTQMINDKEKQVVSLRIEKENIKKEKDKIQQQCTSLKKELSLFKESNKKDK